MLHIANNEMGIPAKVVLMVLADHHNQETGRCDPSIGRIVAKSKLSERAVRMALRELEKINLIVTVQRTQRTGRGKRNLNSRYRIKGGAQYAARMGHNMPPNQGYTPSAYHDIAMSIEDPCQWIENDCGGRDE